MSNKNRRAYSSDRRQSLEDLMEDSSPHYRRQARFRVWTNVILKILILLTVIAGLIYGFGLLWDKFVEKNQDFKLEEISFETNGNMTEQDVRAFLNLTGEENVLFLDTQNLTERLKARPDIVRASVHRELPATLVIEIEERQPIAWLESPQCGIYAHDEEKGLFSDSSGYIFRYDRNIHSRYKNCPVLHVAAPADGYYVEGEWLEGAATRRGLAFLKTLPLFSAEGLPPAENIDFPNDWSIVCKFSNGMDITFGLYDHERQLHDLVLIMQYAGNTNRRIKSANLIPSRNAPVVFVPAGAEDNNSQGAVESEVVVEVEIVEDDEPGPPAPVPAPRANQAVPVPAPAPARAANNSNTRPPRTVVREKPAQTRPARNTVTQNKPKPKPKPAPRHQRAEQSQPQPKPQPAPQPPARKPVEVPSFNW